MKLSISRSKLFMILAVIFAAGAAFIFMEALAAASNEEPVVVAARDIPQYATVTQMDVRVASVPVRGIHPKAVRQLDRAIGRISGTAIAAGQQVIEPDLVQPEQDSSLTYRVGGPAFRAMTVAVDAVQALGGPDRLRVGSRVDVVANMTLRTPNGEIEVSKVLPPLAGVEVIDLPSGGGVAGIGGGNTNANWVTLRVTPDQAEVLAYAAKHGTITLLLNGYQADVAKAATTPGVDTSRFLSVIGWVPGGNPK